MEIVGGVASTVTLVEVAGKIGLLCAKYISEARGAKEDAERIMKETSVFSNLLKDVDSMLNGPAATYLKASKTLDGAVRDSRKVLEELQKDLEQGLKGREKPKKPGIFGKLTKFVKIEDLKWPFEKKDALQIIENLRALNGAITLALQVDGISLATIRDQRANLDALGAVKEAMFGSLEDQYEPQCLPDTRMEVLDSIERWITGPRDSCIFWLRGMAGTGKSTVARTVAGHLKDKSQLGGSFFFKRSQAHRNNSSKFFPTIAYGLAMHLPLLMPYVSKAIEDNPDVPKRNFKEQFDKLIFEPLSQIALTSTVVVIIDALDECQGEREVQLILKLMGKLRELNGVDLRIFITSRPDHAPTAGFQGLSDSRVLYHDLALHDVEAEKIRRDIQIFLTHEFTQMRIHRHNKLPDLWPGQDVIERLVGIAEPLFISAATICRFVDDKHFPPTKRLETILGSDHKASGVYPIYFTVFEQILEGMVDMDDGDRSTIVEEIRKIVSTVIMLEVPLSRQTLSDLILMDEETIHVRLQPLNSILRIPMEPDIPVQTFHLSFRDYLLDAKEKHRNPFNVDEEATHRRLANDCIALLSRTLKRDVCGLKAPGIFASDIEPALRQQSISASVEYACKYWVHHLKAGRCPLENDGVVHIFLQVHLLHWLEATSILGIPSKIIYLIKDLQSLVTEGNGGVQLMELLKDTERFVMSNQFIIAKAPLQVYCSALLFSPKTSAVKALYAPSYLAWVRKAPEVAEDWGPMLLTIQSNCGEDIKHIVFSPDSKSLALALSSSMIELWDVTTGALVQEFSTMNAPGFSPNGRQFVSGTSTTDWESQILLWDVVPGSPIQISDVPQKTLTFKGTAEHSYYGWAKPYLLRFSPNGELIASVSCTGVYIWDTTSGTVTRISDTGRRVVFSPEGNKLFIEYYGSISIFDVNSGERLNIFEYTVPALPTTLAFTKDAKHFVSATCPLQLWTTSGEYVREFNHDARPVPHVTALDFSPDGTQLLSVQNGKNIVLQDVASGKLLKNVRNAYHGDCQIESIVFSPNNLLFASSGGASLSIWDANNFREVSHRARASSPLLGLGLKRTAWSPNKQLLAKLAQSSESVEIWNSVSRTRVQTI
ncbi:hypothetical protein TWF730_004223 [Orbilia blumenaviensis]|uniref:Nephrocystin 3-like N-terminal domain-containing protein n=1 Tax=Orbilia blumenaviensis TaxID=1796055 RepID=A0AAV9U3C8_9PEZI